MIPPPSPSQPADGVTALRPLVLDNSREGFAAAVQRHPASSPELAASAAALASTPETWRYAQGDVWLRWVREAPMFAMKHLVLTRDRGAAVEVVETAKRLALLQGLSGDVLRFIDTLLASWGGCTDELWVVLRDLTADPPTEDPFDDGVADGRALLELPASEQAAVGQRMMDAMRQTVTRRVRRLARPAPAQPALPRPTPIPRARAPPGSNAWSSWLRSMTSKPPCASCPTTPGIWRPSSSNPCTVVWCPNPVSSRACAKPRVDTGSF